MDVQVHYMINPINMSQTQYPDNREYIFVCIPMKFIQLVIY